MSEVGQVNFGGRKACVVLLIYSSSPSSLFFLHTDTVGSESPSLAIRLHLLSQQYNTAIITVGRVIEQHSVQQSTQLSINETIRVNEVVAHISIAKQISKGVQLWVMIWNSVTRSAPLLPCVQNSLKCEVSVFIWI